ncbi:aminomethyl-transferring glycine dehydrogenase [Thioalkalivibrio sp. HK1]|uniref:aminomethyl-transferring glycine dehydrogenase n=1 Tax=Thioalkalivibrio sp. HK1 TaxID=1469245 RepID=UPI0004722FC8|nr:aminomethyl-transferring glycine dehydrogenase [Thioalkalivibrio sp. HK1]
MMRKNSLESLERADAFSDRHIGPDAADTERMLRAIGVSSIEELLQKAVPAAIRNDEPMELKAALGEREALEALHEMAARNRLLTSMIGMGYYGTLTPTVIQRNVLESPSWYTAYTPYQAEVSQGRLEALLNFQQMVMDFTGMELANASLLDEATAAAEAMAMARRVSKSKSPRFFVDADCHPQTVAVISTRARPLGIEVIVGDPLKADFSEFNADDPSRPGEVFGALVQYPGSSGSIRDFSDHVERVHAGGGLSIFATDLLAACLIESPGSIGADVVVGSAQRFGVPMGFGGPHAAFFATRDAFKRQMPGRIIGVSVDAQGKPAMRMALQTREQHIRREKATSNICTAQVLLAVVAGMYAVYHGPKRLRAIAERVHRLTRALAAGLVEAGHRLATESYFDTLTVRVPGQAKAIVARARDAGFNLRLRDADHIGISLDETTRREDVCNLLRAIGASGAEKGSTDIDIDALDAAAPDVLGSFARSTPFLEHPVFNSHHSETEMLRYLRRLVAKDIALDRSMIPLGSCTMKLNATTEMLPISFPGFSSLHPFAPVDQCEGYRDLCTDLERMLCAITGFDAVTLQPNAGSQGEYTGLLCIRRYHESNGQGERDICLIPVSAHGTNPASAIMAGMRVVLVACDAKGNIDIADLEAKAKEHHDRLAALMITYPSTHGVFETSIKDICRIVHDHGGQVYMDGANLNAMVGLCRPAQIGADVSHINLHKTFCIPHGGGGPGMGPVGVKAHLAPYLPDHPIVEGVNPLADEKTGTIGTISAAPYGSASILPISWAYIAMMGAKGLRRATEIAILNANYIATRLGKGRKGEGSDGFPILYTGEQGFVAHECIIDIRPLKESSKISIDDIAKRLIDYGFHAPTMSFPVPDTLMIEPTESESKAELDRFCDAMLAIRSEIAEIEAGTVEHQNSILAHAPHTATAMTQENWDRPYSKERAYFPLPGTSENKYWPPVARVDNVYGDRNLACACAPIEAYAEE